MKPVRRERAAIERKVPVLRVGEMIEGETGKSQSVLGSGA